jgi:hypothetical protein
MAAPSQAGDGERADGGMADARALTWLGEGDARRHRAIAGGAQNHMGWQARFDIGCGAFAGYGGQRECPDSVANFWFDVFGSKVRRRQLRNAAKISSRNAPPILKALIFDRENPLHRRNGYFLIFAWWKITFFVGLPPGLALQSGPIGALYVQAGFQRQKIISAAPA